MLERPLPGRNVREPPLRRALSTFTYLAVALLGDDRTAPAREAVARRPHTCGTPMSGTPTEPGCRTARR